MINKVISGMMFRNAPQAYSGASARATMTQKMSQVADKVDKNNTGNVTKEQFAAAFQNLPMPIKFKSMGADALFDKVDPEKKGSLSRQDFAARMKDVIFQTRTQGTAQSNSTSAASSATAKAPNPSDTIASSTKSLEATAGRQAAASSSSDQRTGSTINIYA